MTALAPRCAVQHCAERADSRGWCKSHYDRWRLYGDPCWSRPERTSNVTAAGYRRIKRPDHPCADGRGWAYEHRVIAWDAHGPIPPGSQVHHVNGDKLDNRPENLRVVSAAAHNREHRRINPNDAARLYREGLSLRAVGRVLKADSATILRAMRVVGEPTRTPR